MRAPHVFVLPTLAEGSPQAVIEAMACGLPVQCAARILDRMHELARG